MLGRRSVPEMREIGIYAVILAFQSEIESGKHFAVGQSFGKALDRIGCSAFARGRARIVI